jgi:hypothetical protein
VEQGGGIDSSSTALDSVMFIFIFSFIFFFFSNAAVAELIASRADSATWCSELKMMAVL